MSTIAMYASYLAICVILFTFPGGHRVSAASVRDARSAKDTDIRSPNVRAHQHKAQHCSNTTIGQHHSCNDHLVAPINQFSSEGTLYSPRKMAFARKLYDGVYLAGQLTPRQIKYAADSGFKSIVSIFDHDAIPIPGGPDFISTAEEQDIVENLAGMKFFRVLPRDVEWNTVEAVRKMSEVYPKLEFPALLHCYKSISVTYLTLLYYANQTRHHSHFHPGVKIFRFYEISRLHGLDFIEMFNDSIPTVEAITGHRIPHSAKKPNISLPNWTDYWESMPVYYNWFIAGQINKHDVHRIAKMGFAVIVNVRTGVTFHGQPSQENVELINIASGTPTYAMQSQYARQTKQGLESSVIDPHKPEAYVSPSSHVNYESRNPDEYGDAIGYNETKERIHITNTAGLVYKYLPIKSMSEFEQYFKAHKDTLLNVGRQGPVLVHCSRGQRAAYIAVLAAALQHDLSLEWSLQRLKELGLGISAETQPDIYKVFTKYLQSDSRVEL